MRCFCIIQSQCHVCSYVLRCVSDQHLLGTSVASGQSGTPAAAAAAAASQGGLLYKQNITHTLAYSQNHNLAQSSYTEHQNDEVLHEVYFYSTQRPPSFIGLSITRQKRLLLCNRMIRFMNGKLSCSDGAFYVRLKYTTVILCLNFLFVCYQYVSSRVPNPHSGNKEELMTLHLPSILSIMGII